MTGVCVCEGVGDGERAERGSAHRRARGQLHLNPQGQVVLLSCRDPQQGLDDESRPLGKDGREQIIPAPCIHVV